MRKNVWMLGAVAMTLVACSGDGGSAGTTTTGAGSTSDALRQCVIGAWTSTSMLAPSQAALGDVTPTGGGDGMRIDFGADGVFQIDFGPMNPATASFTKGGEAGVLSTTYSGVGKGSWEAEASGGVSGVFADLTTVKATVEITLGSTVPPVFDETLQQLNDNRMLNGETTGTYTVTKCQGATMTLTTPFPSGVVTIEAARD
jgi:hypothetical protein